MKNTSFLSKGTVFNLTSDFWVIRPGQPTRHYPAGTPTIILGHKRQRSYLKEMVYTLQLPDGHTREIGTAYIHQAIAPHLSQVPDEKVKILGGEGCPLRTRTGKFILLDHQRKAREMANREAGKREQAWCDRGFTDPPWWEV